MATTTTRLSIPVPQSTDPANVPSDMLNLADALDGGVVGKPYSGAVVFIATPGPVSLIPANPIVGTFYTVNSSPPYLLYYTGESTVGTSTAPSGWRLIGQAGTNTANVSANSPGNAVAIGSQPVWAPLDHQHAMPPWSSGQITANTPGNAKLDGTINAFARADHQHAMLPFGVGATSTVVTGPPSDGTASSYARADHVHGFAGGGGGGGGTIATINNTDGLLTITNGSGPTTTINEAAVPSGELYTEATNSIAYATWVDIPGMVNINMSGGMSASGNALVVPKAGRYVVSGQVTLAAVTSQCGMRAGLYSSAYSNQRILGSSGFSEVGGEPCSLFSKTIVMAAGETVKLQVIQYTANQTAQNLNFTGAPGQENWLTVTWISP